MYDWLVVRPPFQSESLKLTSENQEAVMGHVLDALHINQKRIAEELFSRVSKRLVVDEIERHKSNSLVRFPEPKRILSEDLDPKLVSFVHVLEHRVVCRLDAVKVAANLDGGTRTVGVAPMLEVTARSIGDRLGMTFTGAEHAFLVDALTTSIDEQDLGLWAFKWRQKYAL